MAHLVAHPGVAPTSLYAVKVFSLQEWDQLFTWLAEIEASADETHHAALAAINATGKSRRPTVAMSTSSLKGAAPVQS